MSACETGGVLVHAEGLASVHSPGVVDFDVLFVCDVRTRVAELKVRSERLVVSEDTSDDKHRKVLTSVEFLQVCIRQVRVVVVFHDSGLGKLVEQLERRSWFHVVRLHLGDLEVLDKLDVLEQTVRLGDSAGGTLYLVDSVHSSVTETVVVSQKAALNNRLECAEGRTDLHRGDVLADSAAVVYHISSMVRHVGYLTGNLVREAGIPRCLGSIDVVGDVRENVGIVRRHQQGRARCLTVGVVLAVPVAHQCPCGGAVDLIEIEEVHTRCLVRIDGLVLSSYDVQNALSESSASSGGSSLVGAGGALAGAELSCRSST
ncbi:putative capsid protein [McMurdo Ice Shelf pond-associated circular DNA virus-4]|uniref:putative capsid protein n=1 Tax=McMurdo Ice Shelf pond-associated circular DNA virus-4 TaxID=1521388 RepID=UPI0004D0E823|nr:putative capsid protein [McMurdo Ice Shelf pond-associated circular DNA virus-4]AIF71510.1 putative capsid protein [McMurdo Ice Shelf pond-associated circular DNA virus-4]